MLDYLFVGLCAVFGIFAFVVFFGAPYLPTLKPQIKAALDLSGLRPGQTLLELGCGDGRVLFAAAEQGIRGVGYELNPLLVVYGKLRARRYKGMVSIHWGNFWNVSWPKTDVIFVFLLDKYMQKLDKKIIQYAGKRKVILVSIAFQVPGKEPDATDNGVYRYIYQ